MKSNLTFIIPVFNNEKTIETISQRIFSLQLTNYMQSILFIDDSSTDNSLQIIKKLCVSNLNIKFVSLQKKYGQVIAIEAGLNCFVGDVGVVISADLQDPVKLIEQMINYYENGSEIVIAYRNSRRDGRLNMFFSKIFYYFINKGIPNMPLGGFDYCMLDKRVIEYLNSFKHKNRFLQGDVLNSGFVISFIPYERKEENGNKRLKNIPFKIKYFFDGIIHTTIYPIRFISILGLLTTLLAIFYSFLIFIEWVRGNTPFVGWAPIMISILFTAGVILLTLGVLGEYIWRIYDEVKGTQKFLVKETNVKFKS